MTEETKWTDEKQRELESLAADIKAYDSKLQKLEGQISKGRLLLAKYLFDAQQLLATPGCKSDFGDWIDGLGCDISRSSVYDYIAVHKAFGQCKHAGNIVWTAMIKLAKAKNEKARKKAIELAAKGEAVTLKMSNGLIDDQNAGASPKKDSTKRNVPAPESETKTDSSGDTVKKETPNDIPQLAGEKESHSESQPKLVAKLSSGNVFVTYAGPVDKYFDFLEQASESLHDLATRRILDDAFFKPLMESAA